MREWKISELEQVIGYQFRDKKMLVNAMCHSSYANEHRKKLLHDNERLEFLGDAVLEVTSSDFLFRQYPDMPEGQLTKLRASIVCEPTLALCAREISLEKYLLLGKGEEHTGGRFRASIISDAMEALIGAIYLDGGFANAKEFVEKYILTDIEHKKLFYDSKTILQEVVQGEHEQLTYTLTSESGPDHNKSFTVDVCVGDRILGTGTGHTKKAAEQEAAYQALLIIQGKGTEHVFKKH